MRGRPLEEPGAETDVLIAGAGPVGLTLALDLGRRGVSCLLVERKSHSIQLPKMERCNTRTMEIFRRLGIAEQVRDAGLSRQAPMDVFLAPSLAAGPLVHLPYPSVAEAQAAIAASNDGRPLEPSQVISQYTLEPLLRSLVEKQPSVRVRFGSELESFDQEARCVRAVLRGSGGAFEVRARYLVGCDGGSSTVRKQLGIRLEGEGRIRTLRQALFRAHRLYDRIAMGKGRHYHVVQQGFPFLILQDRTPFWTLHFAADSDAEMADVFDRAVGMDLEFQMLSVNEWTQHLLCADRYASGRVFIAGDAAHLMIPTGGLGMNTGIGDVADLGWKLAGSLAGWGGPGLLRAYEAERRPIGLRNVRASGEAMRGRDRWRQAKTPDEMARMFAVEQRRVTEILGIEAGYRYVDSPLIWPESEEAPELDGSDYVPSAWPGGRLPHAWLEDGGAVHDRLGSGYTLLRLAEAETRPLEAAFRSAGAPLDVVDVTSPVARELYERDLLLVRPDLHVVWRGNVLPERVDELVAVATGHQRGSVVLRRS